MTGVRPRRRLREPRHPRSASAICDCMEIEYDATYSSLSRRVTEILWPDVEPQATVNGRRASQPGCPACGHDSGPLICIAAAAAGRTGAAAYRQQRMAGPQRPGDARRDHRRRLRHRRELGSDQGHPPDSFAAGAPARVIRKLDIHDGWVRR